MFRIYETHLIVCDKMHWDQDEEPKASTSLIEEIRLNSAGMQQVHPTFHVSVFSIGPDMAREAITTKTLV